MYNVINAKQNFAHMEEEIIEFWQKEAVFKKSIEQRSDAHDFIYYDGPPFATGLPHFGNFVPGIIKDIIPRYQTMKGKRVIRRFGWDCHGLPVEYEIEKSLGISGKRAIEAFGIAKFNEECRNVVLRYTKEWEASVIRTGRWIDFDDAYRTMDPSYMESIWWVFKTLWNKDLIYEGYYVLPYSPQLATPLSNFELNLGTYKDVYDPSITVCMRVIATPDGIPADDVYFMTWTTTPWTLPSNQALCVGKDIAYSIIQPHNSECQYIIANNVIASYFAVDTYNVIRQCTGIDLLGWEYEPILPYFAHMKKDYSQLYTVRIGSHVTDSNGTGIVHTVPAFGEEDYIVMKDSGIPIIAPIDDECIFTDAIPECVGLFVKDADKVIIRLLKENGSLFKQEQILHSYPFCYRTDSPIIYRAVSSWFVRVERIKELLLANNAQINWIPAYIKDGRFGKWLENARDWAISRNRFWGNPLPIWKSDVSDYTECIGSIAELEEKTGKKVTDLHKHHIDALTWQCPKGGVMRRISQVLDCWFESGAMPYAQNHYPFENKAFVEENFPADFIAEGLDQTRGWFYTLVVISSALFEKPPFLNAIVNGLVLAHDGRKMSKSKKNYSDPMEIISKFSADALRLFLMDSQLVRGDDLKYTDDGVKEVLKTILIPLWNAYSFFVTYANIDEIYIETVQTDFGSNPLDLWILSELESLIEKIDEALSAYEIQKATQPLVLFIDILNNWYIRRSRRRFWKSENDMDKMNAYYTLHEVLLRFSMTAAPIIPFITENIYRNLRLSSMPISVHLCNYPHVIMNRHNELLEQHMMLARQVVTMGRSVRNMYEIKLRQPLAGMHIVTKNKKEIHVLMEMHDIIKDELNIKEVWYRENEEELVTYKAKANYKVLGQILGKRMKAVAHVIASFQSHEIKSLIDGNILRIEVAGEPVEITQDSIIIERIEKEGLKVHNEGSITVAMNTELTQELLWEGWVRDLVRSIQNMRKQSNLLVTDRINVCIEVHEVVIDAITVFYDYFCSETLCKSLHFAKIVDAQYIVLIGDYECKCTIAVA